MMTPWCARHAKTWCGSPSGYISGGMRHQMDLMENTFPLCSSFLPYAPLSSLSSSSSILLRSASPRLSPLILQPPSRLNTHTHTSTPPICLFLWNVCIPQLLGALWFFSGGGRHRLGNPRQESCCAYVERKEQ